MRDIYIAPGTLLNINLCTLEDEPLTRAGWLKQGRPNSILAQIIGYDHIKLATFATRISYSMGRKDKHHRLLEELKEDLIYARGHLGQNLSKAAELRINSALAKLAALEETDVDV